MKPVLLYEYLLPGSKSSLPPAYWRRSSSSDDRGQHAAVEEVQRVAIRVAGDVVHQVEQRDVLRARELWIILRDRIVDGQLAVLGEQQDGGAGELLGDGTNRELRVLLAGTSVVQRPFG